ncbi:Retrovirus-related Pol polyprotein from transposon [Abeliophyllum distichum]|uniref:Retrovirus-related Pol polyprotein from transposon n=1 Tax=Abeliophyllum distichum TaxID=126358 RepID=A0ABD1Q5E5_9LAMI
MAEFTHIPEGLLVTKPHKIPTWKLYVDGSLGEAEVGAGILLISPDGHNLNCSLCLEFKASNNATKYEALLSDFEVSTKNEGKEHPNLQSPRLKMATQKTLSKLASNKDSDLIRAISIKKLSRPTIDEALPQNAMMINESPNR